MSEKIEFKVRSMFSLLFTLGVFIILNKGVIEGYNLLKYLINTKNAGGFGFLLIFFGGLILLWWAVYSIIDSILIRLYKEDRIETIKIKLTKQEYDKLVDKYKVYFGHKEEIKQKQIDYYKTHERINKKLKEMLK